MWLKHGQESWVHLFSFWEFYQLLKESPSKQHPSLGWEPGGVPSGGRFLTGLVLGNEKRKNNMTGAQSPEQGKVTNWLGAHNQAEAEAA